MLLDQRDERQERVPPGLAAEQVVGRVLDVATTTTARSNSAANSRPRIIASAMSLIWNSSKHSRAASPGDRVGQRRHRVRDAGVGLLPGVDAGVHVLHEGVEVDAPLARDLGLREEQVHQHGFAAPDLPHEVEPVRPARRLVHRARRSRRPTNPAACPAQRRVVAAQLDPQILQTLRRHRLRRVRGQGAGAERGAVGGKRASRGGCIAVIVQPRIARHRGVQSIASSEPFSCVKACCSRKLPA